MLGETHTCQHRYLDANGVLRVCGRSLLSVKADSDRCGLHRHEAARARSMITELRASSLVTDARQRARGDSDAD